MAGSKWYKCDFHLHTSKSKCFIEDKDLDLWVDKVLEQKLDCVAVTNHNSDGDIDILKDILGKKGVVFFPGVEITCSDSKVHLLVIFDVKSKQDDVKTFLIQAGIKVSDFGEEDTCSSKSIVDIAQIAEENNALIIAAHVNEFSSIKNVKQFQVLEDFFSRDNVVGIQITKSLEEIFRENDSDVRKILDIAIKKNKAILSFSDNPSLDNRSKHGVSGIGEKYSFIKLSEYPTIASLKQALKMPKIRVVNFFEQNNYPGIPSLFLESLEIQNAKEMSDIKIDFNCGFNAVIGGRGTGKSSIVRILRLLLNKSDEIAKFQDIRSEFEMFFDEKNSPLGIDARIVLKFTSGAMSYRIEICKIKKANLFQSNYYRIDKMGEHLIDKQNFLDFLSSLDLEIFSQKQLYALAEQPGQLNYYIDKKIENFADIQQKIKSKKNELMALIREFKDVQEENKSLNVLTEQLKNVFTQLDNVKDIVGFDLDEFQAKQLEAKCISDEISALLDNFFLIYKSVNEASVIANSTCSVTLIEDWSSLKSFYLEKKRLHSSLVNELMKFNQNSREIFKKMINEEELISKRKDIIVKFHATKENGTNLNSILINKKTLEEKIKSKSNSENKRALLEVGIAKKFEELKELYSKLRELREKVIKSSLPQDTNLKIEFSPHRDFAQFEKMFKEKFRISEDTFSEDIDIVIELLKKGKDVGMNLQNLIFSLKTSSELGLSQKFLKKINDIIEFDFYEMLLLLPDDSLKIKYMNQVTKDTLDLSKGSHGQKTSAVLSIVLHLNKTMIVIDQPEDDLDNKLIYGLIVENIIKNKNSKQMIMVTHNANIPVNGDADLIISMNSNSKKLELHSTGELDDELVRNTVCEIVEGGTEAFQKRASKYGL